MKDTQITLVSHACLRIDGEFGSLLCDPWILNEPVFSCVLWKFPAAVIPPETVVKGLDYLYISHSHEDHFHIPSIDYIPRDVQVLLPEYCHHSSLRAQTVERILREMGFYRILKLVPWETYWLDRETQLTVIPSAKSRDHDWENSGFVIEAPDCRMINMNDNVDDEELCKEIHARFDRFDIGFVQTAGVTVFPLCFKMDCEEKELATLNIEENFTLHDRLISMLNLQRVMPFAGDFGWCDERYFEGNWLGRSTPINLENWIKNNYPDREVTTLYPSDTWSIRGGVVRNHSEINWDNYIDEIKKVKERFQKKVDHYAAWIDASDRQNLEERSRSHLANIGKWITQNDITFSARFRIIVVGENSRIAFVCKADPGNGFRIDWNDRDPVDQTIHVPERIWAAILEGKIMWNMYQWTTQIEQHVPYRLDIGRFRSWMEYHVDLGNKNTQVIIEPRLFPEMDRPRIQPKYGVVEFEDDWDFSGMKEAGTGRGKPALYPVET